jgi:hypothetical protein
MWTGALEVWDYHIIFSALSRRRQPPPTSVILNYDRFFPKKPSMMLEGHAFRTEKHALRTEINGSTEKPGW